MRKKGAVCFFVWMVYLESDIVFLPCALLN